MKTCTMNDRNIAASSSAGTASAAVPRRSGASGVTGLHRSCLVRPEPGDRRGPAPACLQFVALARSRGR